MKQDYKIPEWLTKAYLLKVLKSDCDPTDEIVLLNSEVDSATNKGDNYASEMFRIILQFARNGRREERRIILKKDHDKEDVKKFFESYNLYSTEIDYYRLYLPEFEKILREATGAHLQLSPRMIYHESPVFIMEDMSPLNYRTVSRDDRFNLQTAKLILAKLAKYHSASMVYNKRTGGSLEQVKGQIFEVKGGFLSVLLKKLDILMEDMKSWSEDYHPIIPKLKFIRDNYNEIGQQVVVPTEGMGVFIHGDVWINNILIRFEKEAAMDVLLIDLQVCFWSSPAYDLLYFIFTSLNEEDYQSRFDELIKHYHDNLVQVLHALDFPNIPTLMQLHLEIQTKMIHAVLGGVLIKSVIYSEKSSTANAESIMKDQDERDLTFENERFRNEMKYLMKFLDNRGALDLQL